MVTINDNPNHQYPAYIQDMQPDKGPVTVFVEVLGEMCVFEIIHDAEIFNLRLQFIVGVLFLMIILNLLYCHWQRRAVCLSTGRSSTHRLPSLFVSADLNQGV